MKPGKYFRSVPRRCPGELAVIKIRHVINTQQLVRVSTNLTWNVSNSSKRLFTKISPSQRHGDRIPIQMRHRKAQITVIMRGNQVNLSVLQWQLISVREVRRILKRLRHPSPSDTAADSSEKSIDKSSRSLFTCSRSRCFI
jgi:hypothetical protein